jgi:hypothetical protein
LRTLPLPSRNNASDQPLCGPTVAVMPHIVGCTAVSEPIPDGLGPVCAWWASVKGELLPGRARCLGLVELWDVRVVRRRACSGDLGGSPAIPVWSGADRPGHRLVWARRSGRRPRAAPGRL